MRFNPGRWFTYYFPGSFERVTFGIILLIMSMPGVGMIFVHRDSLFPNTLGELHAFIVAWGCLMALIGLSLIFAGVRQSSSPGTRAYRLTHPRLSQRKP